MKSTSEVELILLRKRLKYLYIYNICVLSTSKMEKCIVSGLDGRDSESFYINMKAKPGSIVENWNDTVDVKLSVADVALVQIINQNLGPLPAYIQGRMNYTGSIHKLIRLEGLYQLLMETKHLIRSGDRCKYVTSTIKENFQLSHITIRDKCTD